jgi:hypothetical protein
MHNWLAERDASLVTNHTFEELHTLFAKYQTIYRDAHSQVNGEVREAEVAQIAALLRKQQGLPPITTVTSSTKTAVASTPLSEVIQVFQTEQVKAGNWAEKTVIEHSTTFKLLIDILDDKPIEAITHADTRAFKAALQNLPVNVRKKKQYRDCSGQVQPDTFT